MTPLCFSLDLLPLRNRSPLATSEHSPHSPRPLNSLCHDPGLEHNSPSPITHRAPLQPRCHICDIDTTVAD